MKKRWKAEYYICNLTERVEKTFFTKWFAILYGMYIGKHVGFRTRVKKIEC